MPQYISKFIFCRHITFCHSYTNLEVESGIVNNRSVCIKYHSYSFAWYAQHSPYLRINAPVACSQDLDQHNRPTMLRDQSKYERGQSTSLQYHRLIKNNKNNNTSSRLNLGQGEIKSLRRVVTMQNSTPATASTFCRLALSKIENPEVKPGREKTFTTAQNIYSL